MYQGFLGLVPVSGTSPTILPLPSSVSQVDAITAAFPPET
jgi:hypothetical protein